MHRKSFIEKLLKTTTFGPLLKTENLPAIHIENSYAVAKLQKYWRYLGQYNETQVSNVSWKEWTKYNL